MEKIKHERIGESNFNNNGQKMTIIEYFNSKNISIIFEDGTVLKNRSYSKFRSGEIASSRQYIEKNKKIRARWRYIKERCSNCESYKKNTLSTYKNVTLCDEWFIFENFKDWYEKNEYMVEGEDCHIDKDILIKGNKVYSPNTCIFVPKRINSIFAFKKTHSKLPSGVEKYIVNGIVKYKSRIYKDDKEKYLGIFETKEEAFEVYKTEKEKYIKEVADSYKGLIPEKLYNAMYEYKI